MNEIILRLGSGSLEEGFPSINVELRHGKYCWEATTSLVAAPNLKNVFLEWKFLYQASLRRGGQRGVKFAAATPTHFSVQDIYQITHKLTTALNDWLNQGDFYTKIQAQLRTDLNPEDSISIAIITDDLLLWQLPWHRWDFFAAYDRCVEFFSKPQFKTNSHRQIQPNGRVDILAIWGNAPELDLAKDLAALKQPRAHVKSYQPRSALEISNRLAQQQIDILFFGGHGETIELNLDGNSQTLGTIYLDRNTPIPIDKIKTDLKQAVDRGLQIAIFNCCSGLGLAQELADLNIPYLIVMRSQIPDILAQQFCRDLLDSYSRGNLFTTAFQYARERLKPGSDRHDEFESWLPMLFHNPNSDRVIWQDLSRSWWDLPLPQPVTKLRDWLAKPQHTPIAWLGISLLSTGITLGFKSLEPIQTLERLTLDKFQIAQVAMMPARSHVIVIDVSNHDNQDDGRVIPNGEYISSEILLRDLAKVPFSALGLDLKIERQGNGFLDKSNVSFNCANLPPTMNYTPQAGKDCTALAWVVTKNYAGIDTPRTFILNPHLAASIAQINLSQLSTIKPALLKDKVILVGSIKDRLSPIFIHGIATEQILHHILLTPTNDLTGTIYILFWSSLSGWSIFVRGASPLNNPRRLIPIAVSIIILSIGTGWLLFSSGYLVPLVSVFIAIAIGNSLSYWIKPHSELTSL
jgi:CHASE2 domain-containing sensor protein